MDFIAYLINTLYMVNRGAKKYLMNEILRTNEFVLFHKENKLRNSTSRIELQAQLPVYPIVLPIQSAGVADPLYAARETRFTFFHSASPCGGRQSPDHQGLDRRSFSSRAAAISILTLVSIFVFTGNETNRPVQSGFIIWTQWDGINSYGGRLGFSDFIAIFVALLWK